MSSISFALTILLLLLSVCANAKTIHIIHTNDLHSFFQGTNTKKGGYARLKTVIEQLRNESGSKGIPSLYLDGGDFGEGSSFFAAEKGRMSLRALDLLGVDATVLGNHDYMLGGPELSQSIQDTHLKTPILSANLSGLIKLKLEGMIHPVKDFNLSGLKVRIIGLSTAEKHGQYQLKPLGKITDPIKSGLRELKAAAKEKVDLVISLSHTGKDKDAELIQKSTNLGLVVGGHDHLLFEKPLLVKNKQGQEIPIVQAGANTMAVGSLYLEVVDGVAKILSYEIINIDQTITPQNELEKFVAEAYEAREQFFGRNWNEVIGSTEIILSGRVDGRMKNNRSCWSRHLARMTKESAGADLGLHLDVLQSNQINPGPVTFGNIIDNFTHISSWDPQGWEIAVIGIRGFFLKQFLIQVSDGKFEKSSTVAGLTFENKGASGFFDTIDNKLSEARINGKKIQNLKEYTLALPAEFLTGIRESFPFAKPFLNRRKRLKLFYWNEMEKYIRANSPLRCLEEK